MIFAVSFLGALFAIFASLLVVYSYVMLRLVPRFKKGIHEFIEELGPKAIFERAGVSPEEAMRSAGLDPVAVHAAAARSRGGGSLSPRVERVVFTCEDHGRCVGCPRVLAQFEAIIQHQGADSFDEVEKKCYEQLRDQLSSDELLPGESEPDRQKRIATRVVETLLREGFSSGIVRGVVWGCGKDERATFAGWLSAAREGCRKLSAVLDEERVA